MTTEPAIPTVSPSDMLRQLRRRRSRCALLLGNGFSIGGSSSFRYQTLFSKARFEQPTKQLFDHEDTTNFEVVLRLLDDTAYVLKELNCSTKASARAIQQQRETVMNGLVAAVSRVHPNRPADLAESWFEHAQALLRPFDDLFTTNYDLLTYWTLMRTKPPMFSDGFGGSRAPLPFRRQFGERRVLFLHGALHLFSDGQKTFKRSGTQGRSSLMDQVRHALDYQRYPLYVAEGSAQAKRSRIGSSSYLRYCLSEFARCPGTLVCYGASLSPSDAHLVLAIARNRALKHLYLGLHGDFGSNNNRSTMKQLQLLLQKRAALGLPRIQTRLYRTDELWSHV